MVWKLITLTPFNEGKYILKSFFTNLLQFLVAAIVVALSGCTTTTSVTGVSSNDLEQISMSDSEVLSTVFSSTPSDSSANIPEGLTTKELSNPLPLNDVLIIAFENNPTFAEFSANRELARAEVLNAMAWQNPEFDADLRYVTGDSDDIEYELAWNQPVELPRKRQARRAAAEAMEFVVDEKETSFKVSLRAEVTKAYYTAANQDAIITLEIQNLELTEEIVAAVKRQVDAGHARPIEVTRAKVEELKTKKRIQSARRLQNIAKKVLNNLCGGALPLDFRILESLPSQFEPANVNEALALAQVRHPKLQRLNALKKQKELALQREQIAWHPDFSPGVGFEQEADEESYIVSIGLEIPLWNKNQGGIAKANAELHRIAAQILRAKQEIIREVEVALETYTGVLEEIRAFKELRSAAADALKTETFLYEQGEVDFITLLDARKTAQETESEYLSALYHAHLSRIKLEQSIGITGGVEE